jgi:tetratricopeptide (TPR) repeat protein
MPDGPEAERVGALRRRLGAASPATLANFAWFAARRGAHASALAAAREAVALPGAPRVAWHSLERLVTGRSDGLLLASVATEAEAPVESSHASSLAAAVAAHREGALAVAETCYLAAAQSASLAAVVADGLAVLHEQRQERDAADASWARARATGAPRAAHNQALAAIRRGTLGAARELLATAVRQTPAPDPTLWFLAGYAALLDGDAGDALRALEVAVALDPDLARAHFTLGLAHDRLGNAKAALDATRRGLLLSPWYLPQVWLLTPVPGGAAVELPAGNDGQAGHSGTDDVLLALGRSLLETAHLGESLAVFDQVLVRDPAQPAALFHRGVVLAKLRRYDEALADWEEVGRTDPDGTLGTLSRRHARSARQLAALFATQGG